MVHMLLSSQLRAEPAAQAPAMHTSMTVHIFPSSQAMPFGFAGFEHMPVAGSHMPGS
jgi:hypothetical protein